MTIAANTSHFVKIGQFEVLDMIHPTLASGVAIKKGNMVFDVAGTATVSGVADAGCCLGRCEKDVDQSAGDVVVPVDLLKRIPCIWLANGTSGNAVVLATHFQKLVYFYNDHTATGLKGSYKVAGICWDVSADGTFVLVELLRQHNNALGQEYGAIV